jgi:hypothetical protein
MRVRSCAVDAAKSHDFFGGGIASYRGGKSEKEEAEEKKRSYRPCRAKSSDYETVREVRGNAFYSAPAPTSSWHNPRI